MIPAGASIGVTGATGHLGGLLVQALLADPGVGRVVTVARRPLATSDPRQRHVQADLRSAEARSAFEGVDVLAHLGFQLWRSPAMAEVNLAGAANVLAARPGAVVLASSVAVYGAHADNPLPIDERCTPRPNPECAYAAHKLAAERACLDAAPTVVVRLAAVLGAHADPAVASSVQAYRRVVPAVRGVRQALQFLDEGDATAVLATAVAALVDTGRRTALGGAIVNAGTADWLGAADVSRVAGGRVAALPRSVVVRGGEVARRCRLTPFGADRAVLLCGPLAVSSTRAANLFGWRPTRTSAEVLAAAVAQGRAGR